MAKNFYMAQLEALPSDRGLYYDTKGAWIRCPNPQHSGGMERTPSLLINVAEGPRQGQCYCFGCKKIKGSWNNLVKYFPGILSEVSDGMRKATIGFSFKHFADETGEDLDLSKLIPWPETKDWRGISGKMLVKFNTKVVAEKRYGKEQVMLVFPVTSYGDTVGYIRAKLEKPKRDKTGKKERAYFNMEGEWSKNTLFGYDLALRRARKVRKKRKPVVLWIVEGPRDTMNVAQYGGTVVGLIGSYVGPRKIDMVMALDPDIVIVATDNDDAGNGVAEALKEQLGNLLPLIRLKFKGERDPADLVHDEVKRYIKRATEKI